jgi:hypothetical protein
MVGVSKAGVAELTLTVALSRDFALSHPNFVRGMHVILRSATLHLFFVRTTTPRPVEIRTHHKEMAFILRRPFAVTSSLRQVAKPSQSIASRAFHNTPLKQQSNLFRPQIAPSLSKSQNVFRATFRRHYQQPAVQNPIAQGNVTQRLLYGAGIFGATLVGINFIFNRETREDGGMPAYERAYLNDTFMHTGLGIGIIGLAARQLHVSGWSFRLMSANPWVVLGLGLVGSIGTMYGCMATDPNK